MELWIPFSKSSLWEINSFENAIDRPDVMTAPSSFCETKPVAAILPTEDVNYSINN